MKCVTVAVAAAASWSEAAVAVAVAPRPLVTRLMSCLSSRATFLEGLGVPPLRAYDNVRHCSLSVVA